MTEFFIYMINQISRVIGLMADQKLVSYFNGATFFHVIFAIFLCWQAVNLLVIRGASLPLMETLSSYNRQLNARRAEESRNLKAQLKEQERVKRATSPKVTKIYNKDGKLSQSYRVTKDIDGNTKKEFLT